MLVPTVPVGVTGSTKGSEPFSLGPNPKPGA
jgi:hypothetical protein